MATPLLGLAFAAPAAAQLPVADLRASHTVLTEVPTLRFDDWPPLVPGYPQVIRLRIENFGPADAPDVAAGGASFTGFLTPGLVLLTVEPNCGLTLTAGTNYSMQWPIGLLRSGEFRECDLTLMATGAGPNTPPPNTSARFSISPRSSLVQSPFLRFGGTDRNFTIAPTLTALSDISVRIEPTPVLVLPGNTADFTVLITNNGPQIFNGFPLRGWFQRYTHAFPQVNTSPDPFRLSPRLSPGCDFQAFDITSAFGWGREVNVLLDNLAPGETRACNFRVEALSNAAGTRDLLFTQRIWFDGVIDPQINNNVAALRMIFANPLPVPSTSASLLAALTILLALIGLGALAGPHRD